MIKRLLLIAVMVILSSPVWGQETVLKKRRAEASSAPKDAEVQTALGHALLRAGRFREAENQLRKAARLRGNSIEALYEVAKVKFELGNYRVARAACRSLSTINPNATLTDVCMARAFLIWKRSSRAFEATEKALASDPNHLEALLVLADAHRLRGSYSDSQDAYQRVLRLSPSNVDAYIGLGRLNASAGKKEKAVEYFRIAYQKDSTFPVIQYELAKLIRGAEGLGLVREALQGRPKWDEAELLLGDLSLSMGKLEEAEKCATSVLKRSPNLADAQVLLGRARFRLNDLLGAEKALNQALKLVPNQFITALALADVYAKSGRYDDAFDQYRVAADLSLHDSRPLIAAARLGIQLSRNTLAAGFLDRALQREPDSAVVLALYGDVLMARNDRKQAREYYQRALAGRGDIDRAAVKRRLQQLIPEK